MKPRLQSSKAAQGRHHAPKTQKKTTAACRAGRGVRGRQGGFLENSPKELGGAFFLSSLLAKPQTNKKTAPHHSSEVISWLKICWRGRASGSSGQNTTPRVRWEDFTALANQGRTTGQMGGPMPKQDTKTKTASSKSKQDRGEEEEGSGEKREREVALQ